MLTLIGLGLHDKKDITVKGLEAVKASDFVFLESYTSVLHEKKQELEKFYGKEIILANRDLVENNADEILDKAMNNNVAFLVVGDPFGATTHTDLVLRAVEKGIKCYVINNASILTAIGATGLQLYKFGKTTSLTTPEPNWNPETAYDVIKMNMQQGLHTLILLDLKIGDDDRENVFMTINDAIKILLEIESRRGENVFEASTLCLGCARLGAPTQVIIAGEAQDLERRDFGPPLHSLIVPGKLHFKEEEMLNLFK
ncbi:diphthine synthase [Candidatus Woesearchaeota archaeon]|nr:diphthine synthase [Candidatus Woesearchaeota archaeon]